MKAGKIIKISLISILSLVLLCVIAITLLINFIFTPAKLTPVVLDIANESLNAKIDIESVDLTFFSTFPNFSLRVKNGAVVSKSLNDTLWGKTDSLVAFKECLISVNTIAYIKDNKIIIHNILLEDASLYAFKNREGKSNWDIMKASSDTLVAEEDTIQSKFDSEIDVRNIALKNTNITFDDRNTRIYSRLENTNLKLKLLLEKENSSLKLDFDNDNIIFWQEGELLVNKIKTSLKTKIDINKPTQTFTLTDTELSVNGIKLAANGTFVRDTIAKQVDVDIEYGLHTPSVKTVLEMIPESIMKKMKVTAKGEVSVKGTIKGAYGEKKIPAASLKIQIKDASAKYSGLAYGIDHLSTDFDAYIDLMRNKPSYLNLQIFHFKGAHTDIIASARATDLLTDPYITVNTKSTVDMDALAKTFPLQEGLSITGKLDADLNMKCHLSSLKKQDIGRIKLMGNLNLNGFGLKDTKQDFELTSNASLRFTGDSTLQAYADVRQLVLKSKQLSSSIELLSAQVTSTNPQDTSPIVNLECNFGLSKLKAKVGDTISLYSGKTRAKATISPGKRDKTKPLIGLNFKTDSLFFRANQSKLGLGVAGFDVHAEKHKDSIWLPEGTVGFDKLFLSTPHFGLPIRAGKTKVSLEKGDIKLHNAAIRIGKSNITASGAIYKPYRAMKKKGLLKARLDINSDRIDCNQLINALSIPGDSTNHDFFVENEVLPNDSLSSDFRLFVIPENIDFELKTDIKKVTYDKMLFENVHGWAEIKNQAVHLRDLSMRALDAEMKTVMVYKATQAQGYTGFDFKIKDINVGKLVEFIPSLDTIVPMLRSFKGYVDFDIVAESQLDSLLNIKVPTLKSAIKIEGDSLVLMDGETFAEISKMLMFKNKKQNLVDSISVNITVDNGSVNIYPFLVEIDRYRAAVGGRQGLDMNFEYHISVLKSPIPFKMGVNITGNLDKMKIRLGGAKYKDAVTPVEIRKVDSTRLNMGNEIVRRFRRMVN
ncbi:AsmA family protein [Prevotella sp. 10(H)]|uniref:AsmA family protein n=1 Tax=Prevotella sp. 10(H) TaxID=1158294 RepID=UPI0004A7744A|nr:AsmA family protein [Prevotella sp. 10(H)]